MSKLSAAHLGKRYKARTVVHDVSLEVASGEVVGLLGPNGAGKTTCFYMIVGLVAADNGKIELDGEDLSRLPIHARARRGLSYLPQEASIFRKLTVAENVRAILELQDLDADTLSNRLDALLEDLSIAHLASAPAISLSGGERRRCEIARALATRPRFILLDEPFAGIDPLAVLDIQRIIGFFKERDIGDKLIAASVMLIGVLIIYLPLTFNQGFMIAAAAIAGMAVALYITRRPAAVVSGAEVDPILR